eukprot:jgi/Orpsp1_1/1179671/evm.model.c7180000070278.1
MVAAANDHENSCGDKYNYTFYNMAGYRLAINVGSTESFITNDGYKMASYSNYGDCIDIYAPGNVTYPYAYNNSTSSYRLDVGTSCSAPLVAGVAASIMSEHPEIQFDNELMRKTLIEMSIKGAIAGLNNLESSDTPNRFLNNGKKSIYSPDNETIKCGILPGNVTATCSDGCCSKDGKCISFKNDRDHQCFIENGCQSEFGNCITMDQSVEECENELKKYEQCQVNISSDVNKVELMQNCKIYESAECKEFYRLQLTEQSSCNVVKQFNNTLSGFIYEFDDNKFNQYNSICFNNAKNSDEECLNELNKYKSCFIKKDMDYSYTLDKLLDQCNNYNFDECFNFFENITEIINEIPSCFALKETNSMDYLLKNKIDFYTYKDRASQFRDIYCKTANDCDSELNGYKECHIDVSDKMEKEEILKRCNIINSDKCKEIINNKNNEESSCNVKFETFKLDYGYGYYTLKLCDKTKEDYENECYNNFNNYKKCFNNDLNDLYRDESNSDKLLLECSNFNSYECSKFYEDPIKIINDISSCSSLINNNYYDYDGILENILKLELSTLQNYNNTFNNICSSLDIKEINIKLCEDKLITYKNCQINISDDMNDNELLKIHKIITDNSCENFYRNLYTNKSKCST